MAYSVKDKLKQSYTRLVRPVQNSLQQAQQLTKGMSPNQRLMADNLQSAFKQWQQKPSNTFFKNPQQGIQNIRQTAGNILGGYQAQIGKQAMPLVNNRYARSAMEASTRIPGQIVNSLSFGAVNPQMQPAQSNLAKGTDFLSSMAGFGNSPITKGILRTTNPIAQKAVSRIAPGLAPIAGRFAPKIGGAVANIGQGFAFDAARGQKPTITSVGIDAATGLLGGSNQFSSRGMAKGMDQGRTTQSKWDPDEVDMLDRSRDLLSNRKMTKQDILDAQANIKYLLKSHIPDDKIGKIILDYGGNEKGKLKAFIKELDKSAKRLGAYEATDELRRSDDFDIPNLFGGNVQMGIVGKTNQIKPDITQLRKQVSQELSQNQASAQLAKQAREALGDDLITKVNQLKKVAKNNTFASGDIETLRSSKYGKLTNEVVESIQEARPDLDEAGALDFALGLPTKNDTRVRKPAELKTLRELETRAKVENQLWEQEFGRNLKEDEFRRMERDWLKSYTSENKVTPKIKGRQERSAVKDNEQALRRLEGEWAASYRTDAPATAKIKNIQDRSAIRQNERQMGRMTNEWQQEANPGVIKPYNRGDLNTQQPFGIMKNFETAKDKGAFSYARETAVRNIEETFGKDASRVKSFVTDKITENETNAVKFRDSIASQLKSVVKKNRIGKNSKDDALVFRFAEGRIAEAELAQETKNVKGVVATANEFRATYDRLLDGINASLSKYGYDPIPKRKDYMTHFQEVGNFFENFGAIFQDKTMRDNLGDKLPTGMSGINMDTKPGKEFFRNALPRTGDKFTESAIGAMERYLEPASRQIYHTDSVQRVRALQSMVEQHAGKSGKNLSNFNSWLSEYGNILAGKKSVVDRPIEKILGRGLLKVGNAVRRRTGANMVGGNLSSALTNFIPLSQSVATTSKPAVMRGLLSSISTDARKIDGVESNFLTRRFQDSSIAKNWTEKASDVASWAFKAVDHFSSRMIVGSKYYEGLSKGMDATSAMRQADDYAARIMADRSFGASPVLFNSQVLGALTQFQLEVNNQLSFIMKDIPKNLGYSKAQVASSIGQVLLYSYLFNGAYEKVTGRRPAFDPLGVALQAKEDYSNEDMKKGQATKNLAQNLVNQIPFASVATGGRMPMSAALPDVGKLASGESTLGKEALKPLTYLAPPFGGGQIKKTIEGLRAYNQGASTTPSGRVRYPIEKTPVNAARTAVFGQYSTPEARDYFRSGTTPMGEKQSGRILSGITSGLFGGNKVSAVENSTALNIPTNPEEAKIFYKQALQEINNAKGNRIKYTYDSSLTEDERKKKLDTEMEKNVRAVNTINQMRKQNPDQVFGYELESHATGGSKTTEQRAKWVHQTLKNAKSDKELSDLLRKLYQGKVLTQSVAEMLNEEYGLNLTHYMSGDKLKSLGGSGKKGKKTISDAQILSSYRKTLEAYAKPRARYKSFSEEMGNRQSAPIRLKRQRLAKLY